MAELESVVLEKVAAADKQILPDADIDSCLDVMVRNDQLLPTNREKVASALRANPAFALQLAARVSTFSADAHMEGVGLPKDASHDVTTIDDPTQKEKDAWSKVATHGA